MDKFENNQLKLAADGSECLCELEASPNLLPNKASLKIQSGVKVNGEIQSIEKTDEKINQLNPVVWAFVGDAVFSLYVRAMLANKYDFKSGELTKRTSLYVKATAQSAMLEIVTPFLTATESDIVKRARNCHTGSKAKNAGLMDYKRATALEGLFGWLYLNNQHERLNQLQKICADSLS